MVDVTVPLGIYVSVPFCKAKCTYCNFASGVHAAARMDEYVERLCGEIRGSRRQAGRLGATLPDTVDTVFFGGGTPSLLSPEHFQSIFTALRGEFSVAQDAEITIECAPGQMPEATLEWLLALGMSRISFGVQSFVDQESRAVGRLHTGAQCIDEVARMHRSGIDRVNVDLIAGLPHQTRESWRYSLQQAVETEASHVSVYMLEVDEDSRLGRELIGEGVRYGAGLVPDESQIASMYTEACESLGEAGIAQYEISNFSRKGEESRHNLKYWHRDPYLGFGLDAHSMLLDRNSNAVRFANCDDLDTYLINVPVEGENIDSAAAFEEAVFLGLRLNRGISVLQLREDFSEALIDPFLHQVQQMQIAGMVQRDGDTICLTNEGRLLSNTVFTELFSVPA